ncbi:S-adenosyl-L-methionine-dependent methyltransferase [Immersiella caudata]|uniref:S-adenosyl-L-methionine-dependent methyltransferase n=1 Tax=Immersiella caudata TaxID=314043 RepID=A0AA39WL92_9PEZI|nr:S-adenosyl-L-methionine-dependent methyltransferase [Immersiella caudata]
MTATFAEENAKHFDKVAPGDWPQWVLDLHQQILSFLASSDEFAAWAGLPPAPPAGRRMLDYACGDGLITRALRPLFTSALGVDVSGAMLDKYRAKASQLGYVGPQQMVGVRGDFISSEPDRTGTTVTEPQLPESEIWDFDLVVISMALHHLEEPDVALRRLAARLKAGGKLLVVDWTPLDGSTLAQRKYQEELRKDPGRVERIAEALQTHAARHTISKPNGFPADEMRELYAQAGCKNMQWKLAEELSYIPVLDAKAQLYWSVATKAV